MTPVMYTDISGEFGFFLLAFSGALIVYTGIQTYSVMRQIQIKSNVVSLNPQPSSSEDGSIYNEGEIKAILDNHAFERVKDTTMGISFIKSLILNMANAFPVPITDHSPSIVAVSGSFSNNIIEGTNILNNYEFTGITSEELSFYYAERKEYWADYFAQ